MKKNDDLINEDESKKIIAEILKINKCGDDEYIENLSEVESNE